MKKILTLAGAALLLLNSCGNGDIVVETPPTDALSIPLGGNTYTTTDGEKQETPTDRRDRNAWRTRERVGDEGIANWKNAETVFSVYFKLEQAGELDLFLKTDSVSGESQIKVSADSKVFNVKLKPSTNEQIVPIGRVKVTAAGYYKIDLQGVSRAGNTYAAASNLIISGTATQGSVKYVQDGFSFHFGRRGPSVHLNYPFPEEAGDIEWFYNEVTIPEGDDVIGSYFMSNGFGEGYFGMQVNRETERRILFSVWSPFETDNPQEIPEDQKIKLLRKGENVNTGEFGNEGSGGQSFMRYMWKAGSTYRFLTHIRPTGKNSTIYTSYFFSPEENNWMLIAEFERPLTDTYYKRAHSFLENFSTSTGYITRQGHYGNQWAYSKDGKWYELTKARFTADATARQEMRLDYKGGVTDKGDFFMQNCGFFNDNVAIGTEFDRPANGTAPEIDFSKLP